MNGLLVVPTGAVTAEDRQMANQAGYCVIECENPAQVRLMLPESALHADDLTMAALEAIQGTNSSSERAVFTTLLFNKIKQRRAKL